MDNKTGPEIGTTAAAVESCVSVLSAVTGQREEIMAYWLDLYYQVRRAHERAKEAIEAEAAASADRMRTKRFLEDAMNKSAEKLVQKMEEVLMTPPITSVRTGDSSLREGAEKNGPPRASAPTKGGEAKPKPTGGAGKPRPAQVGNAHAADAAAYKREVRDKLLELRKAGVTVGQIGEAGRGTGYTEGDIYAILEGKKIGVTVYRAIDAALGKLAGCIGQEK